MHRGLKEYCERYIRIIDFPSDLRLITTLTTMARIMGLEAADDPSIERLDGQCETRLNVDQYYMLRLIMNAISSHGMALEAERSPCSTSRQFRHQKKSLPCDYRQMLLIVADHAPTGSISSEDGNRP